MDDFSVYSLKSEGQLQDVVALLPSDNVFDRGLVPEAIVGALATPLSAGGQLEPGNFKPNKVFVQFLHRFIAAHALSDPASREEARRVFSGHVYLIDARTPTPQGEVPPEDIIGAFRVENGEFVAGSYQANPQHAVLSYSGFFRLSPRLMDLLRETLRALSES